MTTTRTTTTTRAMLQSTMAAGRGRFSLTYSVLLLCAALLLTKSSGTLALSGDGNLPADAWSETTAVDEGSGWDVTILSTDQPELTTQQEEVETDGGQDVDTTTIKVEIETTVPTDEEATTVNPNEPEQEITDAPNDQHPTAGPGEEQPNANPSEQPSTAGPGEEQPTTSLSEEQPTTSPSEVQTTTPEAEPVDTTIAPTPPAPPAFVCQAAGVFAHISGDCQRFHNCLLDGQTGELIAYEMVCPPLTAFSPLYGRCVRDLAACQNDGFVCVSPGRFAGSDDTYYYNCLVNQRGGYHKYIVRCSPGQRFEPLIGRCWRYDWTQVQPGQALEASDLAAIKREQKEYKADEKLRKKADKLKEKEARKQQKLEEKLAKKAAKEQAKKEAEANKPLSVESAESPEQPSLGN